MQKVLAVVKKSKKITTEEAQSPVRKPKHLRLQLDDPSFSEHMNKE